MLTKDEFEELIIVSARIPRESLDSGARLDTTLGLDSFGLLELTASLAELGVRLDERQWLSARTIDELYDCYRGQFSEAAGNGRTHPGEISGQAGDLSPAADQPGPPVLAGQFFRLAPVLPQSVPFLYDLAISPDVGFRWRYRGSMPSYQHFEQELWQGILVQFLVESVQTGQPAGHLICYNPEFNLGNAYIGAAMAAPYLGSGIAAEPVQLFINYVFDVWPFRKLYLEMPEFNFRQFASAGGRALHLEARLRDHDYYRGRRWDRLILAAYRPGEAAPARTDHFA
ncbi:acetyltransferase, ribosomal protein N-acetylase [Frankia sp. EI5c]|uniref:phosphopantetheine-binding protein n=1 Tax=Frankia sp. EI5c TaxID=683316 RepID=UPI0007C3E4CC|nr:phosphopantetheine-binding protein [Frankia sp. EI5c]OAA18426.1 acetyltransferase, ribosomal protein N-acetylase [Frankia sp. EI5c]